jgi:hypothetical protein
MFMKKFLLVIVLFVITMFVSDLKADCPPGFTPGGTSTFVTCAGCEVTVTFCIRWDENLQSYNIFIEEIRYLESFNDACLCGLDVPLGAYRGPIVDDIILGILNNNEAIFGETEDLVECAPIMNELFLRMRVVTGGCYRYSPPGYPDNRAKYTICNPYLLGECQEYYTICKEWVNDDHWERKVKRGPTIATFDCDNPLYLGQCVNICR